LSAGRRAASCSDGFGWTSESFKHAAQQGCQKSVMALGLRRTWRSLKKRVNRSSVKRTALQEQVAGQQKVILDQQARIADLEGRLKTAETEGEKAQQKISELEFRIELSCAELIRSKGQIDFVRDLMLQQIRL